MTLLSWGEAILINWILPPKPAVVSRYVEHYWFLQKQQSSAEGGESSKNAYPKLNPDPAAHLILASSALPYCYQTETAALTGEGSHWLLPYRNTYQLDHSQPFALIGIKFRVGALYSLAPLLEQLFGKENFPDVAEPAAMLDQIIAADIANLPGWPDIDKVLMPLAINDPQACADALDQCLFAWFSDNDQAVSAVREDKHSALCRQVLPLLTNMPIAQLGEHLHCSQRTLERSFRRVAGLTLKQVQSMNRFEAMLEYLVQQDNNEIDWVDVAFRFGFSDQPHLIRHLKTTIGTTPSDYAVQRNLTIDIYGGIDWLKDSSGND